MAFPKKRNENKGKGEDSCKKKVKVDVAGNVFSDEDYKILKELIQNKNNGAGDTMGQVLLNI